MKVTRVRAFVCALIFSMLLSGRLSAQAPLEPAQLPSRTSFYLIWRGTPAGDARKTNALFALWDDPDFAPVRAAMFANMTSPSQQDASKPALTPEEAEQYSSLLENAFVVGYLSKPEAKMTASAAPPKPTDHTYNGLFFVYDRTGKEALLSKAVVRMRGQEKELPQISQITVAGVPTLKVERKTSTTYWVEHGKYAASASERSVLEDILGRLEGKGPDSSSLAQSAAYKEAQPQLGGGVIEFFAGVPSLKGLAPDSASGFKLAPVLNALKLEAIHSFSGRVILEGAKTRFQGAILGDTAPGALFDFWTDGLTSPTSLSLLQPNAISYSETQFNLPGFYEILKRGVAAAMPPGQQNATVMVDAVAQQRLGMPLSDALALPSGEFASMQLSPSLDPQKAVYVFGIRKKPETLKLLRSVFGDQITSERAEGDTTFLKISLHGNQGSKRDRPRPPRDSFRVERHLRGSIQNSSRHLSRKDRRPELLRFPKNRLARPESALDRRSQKGIGNAKRHRTAKSCHRESPFPADQRKPASLPQAFALYGRRLVERRQRHPFRSMARMIPT
jgi:hypothetical protein